MTKLAWKEDIRLLEELLGFLLDCPRCRAWNLRYQTEKQMIHINCRRCGLELSISKRSLVYYTGTPILPL